MNQSDSRQAGVIEIWEGRGVFVPDGLTAQAIMAGARVLQRDYNVAPYTARAMAIAVLQAADGLAFFPKGIDGGAKLK